MIVNVNQKKWRLFGKKYIISIDNVKKYEIEKRAFSIKSIFEIKEYGTWKSIGWFKNGLGSIKANTEIEIDKKKFFFKQESITSMKYHCQLVGESSENFLIQSHHGHTTSIFKNNTQVGWWNKNSFVILEGNKYQIEMNDDEDPILFSVFAILVDNFRISVTIGGDIGWELGNVGKGLTSRDENWNPKKIN